VSVGKVQLIEAELKENKIKREAIHEKLNEARLEKIREDKDALENAPDYKDKLIQEHEYMIIKLLKSVDQDFIECFSQSNYNILGDKFKGMVNFEGTERSDNQTEDKMNHRENILAFQDTLYRMSRKLSVKDLINIRSDQCNVIVRDELGEAIDDRRIRGYHSHIEITMKLFWCGVLLLATLIVCSVF
jgi:hypothetical protein